MPDWRRLLGSRYKATSIIGSQANRAKGLEVQKQSIVLLQNRNRPGVGTLLPLRKGVTVYTMGMGRADVERYGFTVIDGNAAPGQPRPGASGADVAIILVQVRNANTEGYRSKDAATGANTTRLNPLIRRT